MPKGGKHSLLERLWLLAPISIWFSYQPLVRFGQDSTMYFEVSVTMVFLLILALASLPAIWRRRRDLVKKRAVWLVGGFVIISSIGLFWTANLTRGILSSGVLGMLFLAFLGAVTLKGRFTKLVPKITKIYLASTLVICILALLQFILGLWLGPDQTLLCAGCVADQFGFVRPNVFMIEPQFLGNALLPAGLILAHQIITKTRGVSWPILTALALVVLTLVLTLSRGALLAFAIGVTLIFVINYRKLTRIALTLTVLISALILALGLQGVAGAINPKMNETFLSTISRSVNQLSMDLIDLTPAAKPVEQQEIDGVKNPTQEQKQPNFDGYVEESTSARTIRSEMAIDRWNDDLGTILFGAGAGSAGKSMNDKFPSKIGAREIVQNEYVEILLEKGLIGLVGFLTILAGAFWVTRKNKWLWSKPQTAYIGRMVFVK